MYKLLLVEDEELVRKSIISKLDWKDIGFDKVLEAEDGEQALEISLKEKPDVVLTDIRMPFMDGLELSQRLSSELPSAKIVIISGHDEFEYAQKSIELGILNYILKPINSTKLREVLIKIKNQLDNEILAKRKILEIESHFMHNLSSLQDNFFNALLNSKLTQSEISENLNFLQINLHSDLYLVSVMEIDNLSILADKFGTKYIAALNLAVSEITNDFIGNKNITFSDSYNKQVILFGVENKNTNIFETCIYNYLTSIKDNIKKYLDVTVTIGIGTLIPNLSDIKISYHDALKALDYKFTLGNDNIYTLDTSKFSDSNFYFPINKINPLLSSIKFESLEQIQKCLDDFLVSLTSLGNISAENIKLIIFQLINEFHRVLTELNKESGISFSLNFDIYKTIHKCETLNEIRELLLKYIKQSIYQLRSSKNHRNLQVIERAKEYINSNYSKEDLSLNMVADIVSVSAGYLSILFKKETGITFVEYITKIRMEKSKELLKLGNLKSYEVAYQVGFRDPHYFSICFKKYTGVTPSEYININ